MMEEVRIIKMEMIDLNCYKLHVDLYKLGMSFDEYQKSGYIYVSDVSHFDPEKSVKDFSIT